MLKLFSTEQLNSTAKEVRADNIVLRYGFESITVTAAAAEGMTVQDLFAKHAKALGVKADRLTNFRGDGNSIGGETIAQPGTVYAAVVASESKGC